MRVLTEFIPPDVFGTVSLLMGVSALAQSLFSFPLGQSLLRFYPEYATIGNITLFEGIIQRKTPAVIHGLSQDFS